jgi:4'-phosphopantetheinyl transferase
MWAAPPPGITLRTGEAHVWRADLDSFAADLPDVLSPDERERAARFRFDRDRAHHARSHAALRLILAGYTGIPPAALRFQTAVRGKPFLDPSHGSDVRFSLSRSRGLALLAFAPGCEIGVDIECFSGPVDAAAIAARWFPPEEAALIGGLAAGRRAAVFSRLWARREACAKATGAGLGEGLPAPPAADWLVRDLDPGPGCAAALAVHAGDIRVLTWEYRDA